MNLTSRNQFGYMRGMEAVHPLAAYRKSKGLNATELAGILGVKRNTVWRWENRKRRIDPGFWGKINRETGIPIETLASQVKLPEAAE